MKKNFNTIVTTISCIAVVLCLLKINKLENQISDMKNYIINEITSVNSSVQSIYRNVDNQLNEQTNPLSKNDYVINGFNAEEKTANITYYIIPKEYNPDVTTATITVNGKEYLMEYIEGQYKVNLDLSLLTDSIINNIKLNDNGNIRTCNLEQYINAREEVLPTMLVHPGSSYNIDYINNNKGAKIKYSGYINMDFIYKGLPFEKDSFEIVAKIDNKEVYRKQAVLDKINDDGYMLHSVCEFTESFELSRGSVLDIYIQYTDDNGWQHRGHVDSINYSSNGDLNTDFSKYDIEAEIYTADGKPLFVAQ